MSLHFFFGKNIFLPVFYKSNKHFLIFDGALTTKYRGDVIRKWLLSNLVAIWNRDSLRIIGTIKRYLSTVQKIMGGCWNNTPQKVCFEPHEKQQQQQIKQS